MHRRQFLRSAVTLGTAITLPAAFYKSAFSANLPAEITGFTAIQLSDAIRLRTVSCREVMQAYLAHIYRHNPVYNGFYPNFTYGYKTAGSF